MFIWKKFTEKYTRCDEEKRGEKEERWGKKKKVKLGLNFFFLLKVRGLCVFDKSTRRRLTWQFHREKRGVEGKGRRSNRIHFFFSFRSRRVSSPPDWRWSICPRIDHPHFLKTKILGVAVPRIKHGCKQRHLELASTQVAKTPLRESEIDFIPFSTLFDSFLSWRNGELSFRFEATFAFFFFFN